MIHRIKKTHLTLIAISAWTIVQTGFHVFWIIYGYLLTICQEKPQYYDVLFVYLTYFYRQQCGSANLTQEAIFYNSTVPEDDHYNVNETASSALYHFLNATLEGGRWPDHSNHVRRTEIYLFLFLYSDGAWIVSSVCLIVGVFWDRKHKFMSILFYGPWMLVCIFVCFLDVVASVHYGLDMIYLDSYTNWLKFVGVANYHDFTVFDSHRSSEFVPAVPSTIVVSLLSRVVFVWIVNVLCFFTVLFMAFDMLVSGMVRSSSRTKSSTGTRLRFDTGDELDLNSSAARIRNWQLFYGAIEANSTMTSSSPDSSRSSNSTDHNSNNRSSDEKNNEVIKNNFQSHFKKNPQKVSSISLPNGGIKKEVPASTVSASNIKMQVLRGQLPWSYISSEESQIGKKNLFIKNPNYTYITNYATESSRL